MTDDELADALSSDFTCSIPSAEEKKTSLTEVLIPFFFFFLAMKAFIAMKYFCYYFNTLLDFKRLLTVFPSFCFCKYACS